mgnify:CR=1 FL=1
MKTVYLSSAYLAPIEYYAKLLAYDKVFIEQHDHYVKQTYRNRCTIAAPDGELVLSIPTVKPDTLKCPLKDIRISDHGNWRHLHWNALSSLIDIQPDMERTDMYKIDFTPDEDDFRERIHPKKDYKEEDPDFIVQPYYQVFQERIGFLPNLSIVDLLFNMGPESLLILQRSF